MERLKGTFSSFTKSKTCSQKANTERHWEGERQKERLIVKLLHQTKLDISQDLLKPLHSDGLSQIDKINKDGIIH